MNHITDIDKYNMRMSKSLMDKMFFADKIDDKIECIIDWGCADGLLVKTLKSLFPSWEYLGYDNNPDMIVAAKEMCKDLKDVYFTSDLLSVKSFAGKRCAIVLSSVIHEVYSYNSSHIDEFWETIWDLKPEYVVIRDMCVSRTASRPSDPISVARIRQVFSSQAIVEWETRWGSLDENWSLTHFLLKYHYLENWERELDENYLPINLERLLALIPKNYFPDFVEHFMLPYIRSKVEKDFGIQLQERTHLKLIVKRKD